MNSNVMTPTAGFGIAPAPEEAMVYVGFAAGSGITPILSIGRAAGSRAQSRFFFVLRQPFDRRHVVFVKPSQAQ